MIFHVSSPPTIIAFWLISVASAGSASVTYIVIGVPSSPAEYILSAKKLTYLTLGTVRLKQVVVAVPSSVKSSTVPQGDVLIWKSFGFTVPAT